VVRPKRTAESTNSAMVERNTYVAQSTRLMSDAQAVVEVELPKR